MHSTMMFLIHLMPGMFPIFSFRFLSYAKLLLQNRFSFHTVLLALGYLAFKRIGTFSKKRKADNYTETLKKIYIVVCVISIKSVPKDILR